MRSSFFCPALLVLGLLGGCQSILGIEDVSQAPVDDDASANGGGAGADPGVGGMAGAGEGGNAGAGRAGVAGDSGVDAVADVEQDVALPVVQHSESAIRADTTWQKGRHLLQNSIEVSNGTLTVEACSEIRMPAGGAIIVKDGGGLKLNGKEGCEIRVTSSREAPAPGDWHRLEFHRTADAANCVAHHATFEYGGGAQEGSDRNGSIWLGEGAVIELESSTVRKSAGLGVVVLPGAGFASFDNNTITENALQPISIGANHVGDLRSGQFRPNGVDEILVESEYVVASATWINHDVPYAVPDGFEVAYATGPTVLTVASGVTIKLGAGAGIEVVTLTGLTLDGLPDDPVKITSGSGGPGIDNWGTLSFYGGSLTESNVIRNAILEYGGRGFVSAVWVESDGVVEISDSAIHHSESRGIFCASRGELRNFTGNAIQNCGSYPIRIDPDHVQDIGEGNYSPNKLDAIELGEGSVEHDASWVNRGLPLYATSFGVGLHRPATLTMSAGVSLFLEGSITVAKGSMLFMDGTSGSPVWVGSRHATDPTGHWNEIALHSGGNRFAFASISSGGANGLGQVWVDGEASVTLDDVTFSDSEMGCDISGSGKVTLSGGNAKMCP